MTFANRSGYAKMSTWALDGSGCFITRFQMAGLTITQDFALFCDETGISGDRFMVVGGLVVHRDMIPTIHKNMAAYREQHNMHSELKWSKISNQKNNEYKFLVEYFFAMNNQNLLQFHCVVFDTHTWNHHKYNEGDADIGISKIYYQLILHKFCKIHGLGGTCIACLDHRNSTTAHEDLRRMINAALDRDYGIHHSPLKRVTSNDSKADDLLQLNDVILGAVGAVRNGKHLLETTRLAKREIAALVLGKSALQTFDNNSPRHVNRFTVWNFASRGR